MSLKPHLPVCAKVLFFLTTSFFSIYSCKKDDTVDYIPSDRKSDKFSLETFKFIGENAFIFLHCQVRVCNASDKQSKCVRVCEDRRRRDVTVSGETADDVYPLAQGPITLEKEQEVRGQKTKTPARSSGKIKGSHLGPNDNAWILQSLILVTGSWLLPKRKDLVRYPLKPFGENLSCFQLICMTLTSAPFTSLILRCGLVPNLVTYFKANVNRDFQVCILICHQG